jgi:FkbH-like protein
MTTVMTLSQALSVIRQQPPTGSARRLFLACGFQPLHLLTFLKAQLGVRFPGASIGVETGLYGDLEGTLAIAARSGTDTAVVVEWSDLDPRLGLRSSGGWGPSVEQDILATCRDRCARLLAALSELASRVPVALAGPSLAVPLFGHTAGWQLGVAEAELQLLAARFFADAARLDNVAVLRLSRLAALSAEGARLDGKMELAAGFPYSLDHASALSLQLVKLLYPPTPMKGLITDLDDTLWSGIIGEVGASEVSWRLDDRAQIHGLFQQQLRQLSETGALLAIVSKNEPAVVDEALRRTDLYVPKDAFFPVRAGWNPKSQAVAEVLAAWNVGPESVVFIDDSLMEIEEVRTAFPAMTCLRFPANNAGKALELFTELRDLFGKRTVQVEDRLRQTSIRANAEFAQARTADGGFVRSLQGRISFDGTKDADNKRLLELINKTNQFNLNGVRLSEGEWRKNLATGDSIVTGISYEDKFGPLGVIGVVAGTLTGKHLTVSAWVLSCRAFSRRIEHHTFDYLFRSTGAHTITLSFRPTERNHPLRQFLQEFGLAADGPRELSLSRDDFERVGAGLPHVISSDGPLSRPRPHPSSGQ